ncbi:MAG: Sec-independent protein translocase protein TatB [Pseudomonadota bacterium]
MFGIGLPELIVILVIALIVIGPEKLPGLAKAIGKGLGEFRKAADDLKESFKDDAEFKEIKTSLTTARDDMSGMLHEQAKGLDSEKLAEAVADGTFWGEGPKPPEKAITEDYGYEPETDRPSEDPNEGFKQTAAPSNDKPEGDEPPGGPGGSEVSGDQDRTPIEPEKKDGLDDQPLDRPAKS